MSLVLNKRRYDIEYLRILAVLLLVPFHCAMVFFSYESFYVKSSFSHFLIDYFVFFLSPWHMPILFMIAGMSSFYALQKRTWKQYIQERTKRLFIPFLFSIVFIVPPQPYFAYLRYHPEGTILSFLKQYFFCIPDDFTGYKGSLTPAHLWFVLYLYIYSVASIPLFLKINKHSETISKYILRHDYLLLYPIIIGLMEQLPSISSKNPFYYYTYFIVGYLIVSNKEIEDSLFSKGAFTLFCGIITMVVYLAFVKASFIFEQYSYLDVLFYILRRFNVWFWLIFIFAYGRKLLNFSISILPYASEMSYPFYILHQTVIATIAYSIIPLDLNIWITLFLMIILSFFITFILYHIIIRKSRLLRFLFGMKN